MHFAECGQTETGASDWAKKLADKCFDQLMDCLSDVLAEQQVPN